MGMDFTCTVLTKELYEKLKLLLENREMLNNMRSSARKIKEILSYENIARESIEYAGDPSPKFIHQYFMNDVYLDRDYEYYERISY